MGRVKRMVGGEGCEGEMVGRSRRSILVEVGLMTVTGEAG